MDCKCSREKEISEIHEMMKTIDIALRGNGQPGLFTNYAVLKNTVGGLLALDIVIITGLIGLWLKG